MRRTARGVSPLLLALAFVACGSSEQHTTEQLLLRWSVALNHHLATDTEGGNEYPHRLSQVDPMLRADLSFDDGWGRPLHYRRVNDSLYDLVSTGADGDLGTADDILMSNSTLHEPEKIYARRPANRGLQPQADAAGGGQ